MPLASFTSHTLPVLANWSQLLGIVSLIGGAIGVYVRHTCHVAGCGWPAWHPDPVDGHPRCKKHHPDDAPAA